MKIMDIPFHKIPQFSPFDKAYVENTVEFRQFINRLPEPESFEEQIEEKRNNYSFDRNILSACLEEQYLGIDLLSKELKERIKLLESENTFTIITAHQPSLFTGPLYFIYKIISAIRTARQLEEAHDGINILPVFIIGGEDHDFEEINHFYYKEHTFQWKEPKGGAVGRMPVDNIQKVIDDLRPHLEKSYYGKEIYELLQKSYSKERNLTQATQYFVARLFKDHPLLIVSMDDVNMKKAFIPYIKKEIFETVSEDLVKKAQKDIEELGYSPQAHAREINFFYLKEGSRSRIVFDNGKYHILDEELTFTKESLGDEINNRPERFSPNVIMRPIFQEFVFPNLAYIGGGGELAYWMERKQQFDAFELCFPILMRRHSATLLDKNKTKKAGSFSWDFDKWFKGRDELIRDLMDEVHSEKLDFSKFYHELHKLYDQLGDKMSTIDPTLDYSSEAGRADSLKILERLRTKAFRALKKQEDIKLKRIDAVRGQIFPEEKLQERHDNFIAYYEQLGPELFNHLFEAFTPFNIQMKMITDL